MRRGQVGKYMIKMYYPGVYYRIGKDAEEPLSAGFPNSKKGEQLAKDIKEGSYMFIYVAKEERGIIGLSRVTGPMEKIGHRRWPYDVPVEMVIGPKYPGVTLEEIGIDEKPRRGDTVFEIDEDKAQEIIEALREYPDLDDETLQKKRKRYIKYHRDNWR